MHIRIAAVLTVAAAAALTGCKTNDFAPAGNAPNRDAAGAVVESIGYSRWQDEHSLLCVAPGDRVFEIVVPESIAADYMGGEPCPTGYAREWWPQDNLAT